GGFGENQKVMLAKTIAEIHGVTTPDINKLINRNITRLTQNDLIDLKNSQSSNDQQLLELDFTNMQISKSNNIFLLSERGYTKLVSMMDNTNEIKWQVMDKLIDEYFAMRAIIKSDEQFTNFKSTKNYQFKRSGGNDGKEHKYILRDIEGTEKVKGIIPTLLGANLPPAKYFIESSYKDGSGKTNKCYEVTKMGCEVLGK
uniref:ORF6N domain-containing protein n=1 Tax=Clostridium sp. 1001271B_151109_B4 TaxID=2787148 RepID=UPI001FAE2D19